MIMKMKIKNLSGMCCVSDFARITKYLGDILCKTKNKQKIFCQLLWLGWGIGVYCSVTA